MNEELTKIKKLLATKQAKDRTAAQVCLKRKKMYEKSMDDLDKMAMNLTTQILQLENAKINMEVFKSQQLAKEGLASIHGDVDVDKVEEMTMDLQEQLDIAGEISDALTRPMAGNEVDDDELDDELKELEEQWDTDHIVKVEETEWPEVAEGLPQAPGGAPVLAAAAVAEEDEDAAALAELEASMS